MSRFDLDIHVMGPSGHHEFNFEIVKLWDRRTSSYVFVVYYLNSLHYSGSYLRQNSSNRFGERAQAQDATKFVDSSSAKGAAYAFVNQKTGGEV